MANIFRRLSDRVMARYVLGLMILYGQIMNYTLRYDISMALVAMVADRPGEGSSDIDTGPICGTTDPISPSTGNNISHVGCFRENDWTNENTTEAVELDRNYTMGGDGNGTESRDSGVTTNKRTLLLWDKAMQGVILSAHSWGYALTQLVGGRVAELYGGKSVYGYSLLVAGLLTFLTPSVAKTDYRLMVFLRVLIGLAEGPTWPSLNALVAVWIPPAERSRFMVTYFGSQLGLVISYPLSGIIITALDWESCFYIYGALSLVWFFFWWMFTFDTPDKHPRISTEEKEYIQNAIGEISTQKKSSSIPWKGFLLSVPLWGLLVYGCCNSFGLSIMLAQGPTFMKDILGFSLKANGFYSSLPSLMRFFGALLFGHIADLLIQRNILSTTWTRKLCATVSLLLPAICLTGMAFVDDDPTLTLVLFSMGYFFNGAIIQGLLANVIDIAPNFSGTLLGILNPISTGSAALGPIFAGFMTKENQTMEQWQIIFWTTAGIYAFGAVVFLLLGKGKPQPWNFVNNEAEELQDKEVKDEAEVGLRSNETC